VINYYCPFWTPPLFDIGFRNLYQSIRGGLHLHHTLRFCLFRSPPQSGGLKLELLDEIIERVNAKPLRADPDTGFVKPGELDKIDYQYERCGVASIFVFCEPLRGWRYMEALPQRTKSDFAFMIKKISDRFYPAHDRIILINDNLNTHNISSFYALSTG
jgi:hypothetical protein